MLDYDSLHQKIKEGNVEEIQNLLENATAEEICSFRDENGYTLMDIVYNEENYDATRLQRWCRISESN